MALVAWYKLDGNANDSSGNGHHGTASNVTWVDGKIGGAGSFNGSTSNYISINNPVIDSSFPFSVSLWVKIDLTQASWTRIIQKGGNSLNKGFTFRTNGNKIVFEVNDHNPNYNALSSQDFPLGEWFHLLGIYDGVNNPYFYLNKIKSSGSVSDSASGSGENIRIGVSTNGSTGPLNGMVDDVRIYDHALSEKEIQQLYQGKVLHYTFGDQLAGKVVDRSPYQNNTTILNPHYTEGSLGRLALLFNGVDESLVTHVAELNGNPPQLTISLRSKPLSVKHMYDGLLQLSGAVNHEGGLVLSVTSLTQRRVAWWQDGLKTITWSSTAQGFVHHVIVLDSGSIKVYENGGLVGSSTYSNAFNFSGEVRVAQFTLDDNYCNCEVDDLQIMMTALEEDEIKQLHINRATLDGKGNLSVVGEFETATNSYVQTGTGPLAINVDDYVEAPFWVSMVEE